MTTIHPVYLVGAGPGDPDLLTMKAHRLITSVDVIVYDKLVSVAIMDLAPVGTTRIFAGKQARNHHMPQPDINSLLVDLALSGRKVMRLKGGDPFVFGRGGEEALHLAKNNISFEVIPGITSSAGCAAYAGIPLTHRGLAHGVRFVTGHTQGDNVFDIDWQNLADPDTTLVVYMGLTNIRLISSALIDAGLGGTTPAAIINEGTRSDQKVIITTLVEMPDVVEKTPLSGPTLLIIGKVAGLAHDLAWFHGALDDSAEARS